MKVAILQSSYIPWKGVFDLAHRVDRFVWLDDVQYTRQDWRNRNRIKTPQGTRWLTIPCDGSVNKRLDEVSISDRGWSDSHWGAIYRSYQESPHFDWCAPVLEDLYASATDPSLHRTTRRFVERIAVELLGIDVEFDDSIRYPSEGRAQERLLDILEPLGATTYVSGPAAKPYIEESEFARRDIDLQWMDYEKYPEYPQKHGPFDHHVSIIDLLTCVGPMAPEYIWNR